MTLQEHDIYTVSEAVLKLIDERCDEMPSEQYRIIYRARCMALLDSLLMELENTDPRRLTRGVRGKT